MESKYVCVHSPKCNHYPHTAIPTGEEEWVGIPMPGESARESFRSHHKDCVAGLHYVARDGKRVSPYYVDENLAFRWLMRHQGMSVDWACKFEGYSFKVA
jgi:hypothetical protein